MSGMNPEPMASYSLADRFYCGKCGKKPDLVSAGAVGDLMLVTVECHGEGSTKSYAKKDLVFTQIVFGE
jgi:hypothetical protein